MIVQHFHDLPPKFFRTILIDGSQVGLAPLEGFKVLRQLELWRRVSRVATVLLQAPQSSQHHAFQVQSSFCCNFINKWSEEVPSLTQKYIGLIRKWIKYSLPSTVVLIRLFLLFLQATSTDYPVSYRLYVVLYTFGSLMVLINLIYPIHSFEPVDET